MDLVSLAGVVDVPEDNQVANCGNNGIEEKAAEDNNYKGSLPFLKKEKS